MTIAQHDKLKLLGIRSSFCQTVGKQSELNVRGKLIREEIIVKEHERRQPAQGLSDLPSDYPEWDANFVIYTETFSECTLTKYRRFTDLFIFSNYWEYIYFSTILSTVSYFDTVLSIFVITVLTIQAKKRQNNAKTNYVTIFSELTPDLLRRNIR